MENKTYTTGELAKLCNVSSRTVQFYDTQGIVKPSQLSEGGRRIYSQADMDHFQVACLYKNLGFSLKEIKTILSSNEEYKILLELLHNQDKKLENDIYKIVNLREKILVLSDDITVHKTISITNIGELNQLLDKKEKHKRVDKLSYILVGCFVLFMFTSLAITSFQNENYLIFVIGFIVLLLFGLIYFHSSQNAYVCPNCKEKFMIGFLKDMITLNNGKKGKYLKCPNCHHKNWMSETYKDI